MKVCSVRRCCEGFKILAALQLAGSCVLCALGKKLPANLSGVFWIVFVDQVFAGVPYVEYLANDVSNRAPTA